MADETEAPEGESLADSIKAAMEGDDAPEDKGASGGDASVDSDDAGRDVSEAKAGDDSENDVPEDDASRDSPGEGEDEPESVEPLTAPEHWEADARELFDKLDDDAKRVLIDRDKHWQGVSDRRVAELEPLAKYKQLDQVFEPVRNQFAMQGMTEVDGVRMLLAAHQALQRDPNGTLQYLAKQYGVDLGGTPQPDSEADEFADPNVTALNQQVTAVRSELDQFKQQQQQSHAQALEQQIAQFRDATDDQGNKLHPHFDNVRAHMAGLMQSGAAADMDKAYQMAVWASDDLRKELLAQQAKEADEKARQERRERAEKAKKSASKPKSSSSPEKSAKPDKPKSLNAELREVYEELAS